MPEYVLAKFTGDNQLVQALPSDLQDVPGVGPRMVDVAAFRAGEGDLSATSAQADASLRSLN